jgi:hypothetical protein
MAVIVQNLLFNKSTKAFIASVSDGAIPLVDTKNILIKPIELDESQEYWEGDYDSGSIKKLSDSIPVVHEIALNARCRDIILNEYPLENQINNIAEAVIALASSAKIEQDPRIAKLITQQLFIDECRKTNNRYKTAYQESPDWNYVSKDTELDKLKQNVASGQLEAFGIHTIDI